jgi:hypothetical protein
MNTAQIQGIRQMHNEVMMSKPTMTAREMAETPHNLSRDGNTAKSIFGKYVWNGSQWVRK